MYIVNAGPGFKKMLWPAAQKFLDAKTIAKIQVNNHFSVSVSCPLQSRVYFWLSRVLLC